MTILELERKAVKFAVESLKIVNLLIDENHIRVEGIDDEIRRQFEGGFDGDRFRLTKQNREERHHHREGENGENGV